MEGCSSCIASCFGGMQGSGAASKTADLGVTKNCGCTDGGCAAGGNNTMAAGLPVNLSRGDAGGGGGSESTGASLVAKAHCDCEVTGVPGMDSRGVLYISATPPSIEHRGRLLRSGPGWNHRPGGPAIWLELSQLDEYCVSASEHMDPLSVLSSRSASDLRELVTPDPADSVLALASATAVMSPELINVVRLLNLLGAIEQRMARSFRWTI